MNFTEIFNNLVAMLKSFAVGQAPEILNIVTTYLGNAEQRMEALAKVYAEDQDMNFIKAKLAEEASILKAELLSLETVGEELAQSLIDKVMALLTTLIFNLIK